MGGVISWSARLRPYPAASLYLCRRISGFWGRIPSLWGFIGAIGGRFCRPGDGTSKGDPQIVARCMCFLLATDRSMLHVGVLVLIIWAIKGMSGVCWGFGSFLFFSHLSSFFFFFWRFLECKSDFLLLLFIGLLLFVQDFSLVREKCRFDKMW